MVWWGLRTIDRLAYEKRDRPSVLARATDDSQFKLRSELIRRWVHPNPSVRSVAVLAALRPADAA
jgi:hypothetical protein